ncbi:MAG TPA: GNAT family N-acetyltransferase [Dongiaceae bacterium]|nr:GNAT family N-acetyltransferase [Dongiaceae bacterium]
MAEAPSVLIRSATRDDVPRIAALLADDPLGRQREETASLEDYLTAYDALAGDPAVHCLVAVDESGSVIGYVQVTITRHFGYRGAHRALLEDLRVAPAKRGLGVGTKLIEAAIAAAHSVGCDIVQLFAHHSRQSAHLLYRKMGFHADHLGFRRTVGKAADPA